MGDSKQSTTSTQNQSGSISPYAPTQNELSSILNNIGGINPQVTSTQNQALSTIANNAANAPNYGPQAQSIANNLLTGGQNFQTMVSGAYNQYQGAVSPVLNSSLDPTQTPGLSDALATIRNDVTNSVNGTFAGAGRDMSGLNQQALARGIAQGEAPVIVGQYNQNVANRLNAANGLLGGAQSSANSLSGLQQTQFGNQLQGLDTGVNGVSAAMNAPAMQQLQAAAQAYGLPIQNLAQLEALTIPIAGLGKQYTGTANANSETTNSPSLLSQIGQGVGIAGGLAGFFG